MYFRLYNWHPLDVLVVRSIARRAWHAVCTRFDSGSWQNMHNYNYPNFLFFLYFFLLFLVLLVFLLGCWTRSFLVSNSSAPMKSHVNRFLTAHSEILTYDTLGKGSVAIISSEVTCTVDWAMRTTYLLTYLLTSRLASGN